MLTEQDLYPTKKKEKRNAYSRGFFCFSELDQIFQLLHLNSFVAQSSITLCPEIHFIQFEAESVISLEITWGLGVGGG